MNETYIYEIHVVGFKILGNIFAPPPLPLDVVYYVKRVRSGGGESPPELIPDTPLQATRSFSINNRL